MIKGIGVSEGIAIGKVKINKKNEIKIEKKKIEDTDIEVERLRNSIKNVKKDIQNLHKKTLEEIGEKEAKIFEAHELILEDPEIFGIIEYEIAEKKINAEWAIKKLIEKYIDIFENMKDEYMKERALDLKDVSNQVLAYLTGSKKINWESIKDNIVIIAHELTPSDTAQMDKNKIIGFVTETGGKTSHTAIIARTLQIPAVVGTGNILNKVNEGDILIIDGFEGEIIINPDNDTVAKYIEKKKTYENKINKLSILKGKESVTKDGFKIEIVANIGVPDDVDSIIENDCEGIGLFRTEFLYINEDIIPSEEDQYEVYKNVLQRMKNKPVVIRTLDIGGDKESCCIRIGEEMNPFLGYRAIRISLNEKEIFKDQLRAILRASVYGNVKIMFPLISCLEELREAKKVLEEVKEELVRKKIEFSKDIEVGMMIEVPSTVVISDLFAKEVDFFSIGTNDLIQYTTAVDRGNENISYLYDKYHTAVLRMIKLTAENAHKENIWIGVCGEVAGDPYYAPLLLGLGIDELSMSASSILKIRDIIRRISKKEMEDFVNSLLDIGTATEVRKMVRDKLKEYVI